MATSKSYFPRQNYRFLTADQTLHSPLSQDSSAFEFEESDVYNNSVATLSNSPEFRKAVSGSRFNKKSTARTVVGGKPSSLPVNIPDWSKILKDEYRENRRRDVEDDDDDDDDDEETEGQDCFDGHRVPPHEFLAKTRIASFSVHEGVGRTLKGRDLSRVRNAIWEKTGFQD